MDLAKGPHSVDIDFKNELILLDYYKDQFSMFAGVRRLKAYFSKQ